ncbi:hypothetical protein B296_00026928 [Ensete ventricosum]|uniref:Uncharacterized protein n=1 Tax=Ensete ventricosum TaxID=4639 RepID=A0A426XBF9_ENSVE|nr:hypothetical protein B296_00026928 [Ensete ventricosum]
MIAWSIPVMAWTCLGSLNRCEYHPGMQEDGFSFPNKGNGGGGCGAPSEVICIVGGASSPKVPDAERSYDIDPPSSAKMLLGDPLCLRNQHDMVRPARARAAPV